MAQGRAHTLPGTASNVTGSGRLTFTSGRRLGPAGELIAVVQRLSLARSMSEIHEIVRTAARRLTGADGASIIVKEGEHSFYADEDAISPLWKGRRFALRTCVSGLAMISRRPVAIEDIYVDPRVPHDLYRPTFVRSMAVVPIRQQEPLGAIGNYWASRHRATEEELEVLQALADSTAVAMENVRFYEELRSSRLETLQRLALVAEYRDDNTYQHTERVARTACSLSRALSLPGHEAAALRQAAPLHDVGKLAVPDHILLKRGALTSSERAQVERHASAGAAILAGGTFEVLRLGEEIAASHHERWDGEGYPARLAGEEIPLSGRIVALADVFDALTHERSYKPAWSVDEAVEEISRLRERQFDPDVVDAFMTLDASQLVELPNDWQGDSEAVLAAVAG